MNQLIIDIQYFGTINYNKILFQNSNITFEQYETFQKMSFRNRCVIAGANGLVNLTVPLEKGRSQKELMKDVRISYYENWQVRHWRTIESCYNRSPFFEFYRDGVYSLIHQNKTFLLDLDLSIAEWLKKMLKSKTEMTCSGQWLREYPADVTDLRGRLVPKQYQHEPFDITYTQVFGERLGFARNLCILDLLFCAGPAARNLLGID